MAARKRKWIKGAIKHPGALRRSLKIKGSKPISAKRLSLGLSCQLTYR